ncbi:MAG TPA: ABC transporter permease [Anaerolineae bacterium]|nr:ABC transporter permease [Anaerolineae bacterium]
MKTLDIALKDLLRAARSAFFWVFAFGVPFLTAVLFYFAFGGLAGQGDFDLPKTAIAVVNLDEPTALSGGFSAGQMLVDFLSSDELGQLLQVTVADDAAGARAAVDNQQVGVAVIIPAGLTTAAFGSQERAAIELYQDPTLTLGPSIVKGIVSQLVDGFAGSKIAVDVAREQLAGQGATAGPVALQNIAMQYGQWSAQLGEGFEEGANPLLDIRPIGGEEGPDLRIRIISQVLAGMMVFYVFTTAANSAISILQEEEAGTLPRLFTTPTPQSNILGGKFLYIFFTLVIQIVVLVVVTGLIFGIDWGTPLPVAVVTLAVVVLAASFGLFVASLLKDTRQGGIVIGGGMTMLGMVAMARTFGVASPDAMGVVNVISLFVPHGWAVRAWQELLTGGGLSDIWWIALVMLALGGLFFTFGLLRFRRRFA